MGEAKPCPFCGSQEMDCTNFWRDGDIWFVQCANCSRYFPISTAKKKQLKCGTKEQVIANE